MVSLLTCLLTDTTALDRTVVVAAAAAAAAAAGDDDDDVAVQSVRREATVRTVSRDVTVVTAPSVTQSPASVSVHQAGRETPATSVRSVLSTTPPVHSLT